MAKRWGFTYLFCNDLESMRKFYKDILHLDPIWNTEEAIAFKIGDHQLSIENNSNYVPLPKKFAIQPGWEGGTEPRISWSLECDKDDFQEIVRSARSYGVPSFHTNPTWKGYWSFPILDPMNHTIEITCTEKDVF